MTLKSKILLVVFYICAIIALCPQYYVYGCIGMAGVICIIMCDMGIIQYRNLVSLEEEKEKKDTK